MKIIKYNCDFCNKELDEYITSICKIDGNNNENHSNHHFSLDLCKWCYKILFSLIKAKLTKEKSKNVRRLYY